MNRDRRLGRGLAALLGDPNESPADNSAAAPRLHRPDAATAQAVNHDGSGSPTPSANDPSRKESSVAFSEGHSTPRADASETGELMLFIEDIAENPFQPRRDFGEAEIASLAESLRDHQLLQPILVRRHGDKWQLISGERRLRAARRAGWKKIPARVREADDRLVAELAIVENLQRKDLNAIEKALSFQRYLREHQCTQEDLGRRIKVDRSTIANFMRLLELPPQIQEAVQSDRITAGHAKSLLPLGDARQQLEVCEKIFREHLNVREVERLVQDMIERDDGIVPVAGNATSANKKKRRSRSDQVAALEQDFRRILGTKVDIFSTARGRGRMVVHFRNAEEFERIRQMIAAEPVRAGLRAAQ